MKKNQTEYSSEIETDGGMRTDIETSVKVYSKSDFKWSPKISSDFLHSPWLCLWLRLVNHSQFSETSQLAWFRS